CLLPVAERAGAAEVANGDPLDNCVAAIHRPENILIGLAFTNVPFGYFGKRLDHPMSFCQFLLEARYFGVYCLDAFPSSKRVIRLPDISGDLAKLILVRF